MGWLNALLALVLAVYPLLALRLGNGVSPNALVAGFGLLLLLRVLGSGGAGGALRPAGRLGLLLLVLAFCSFAALDPDLRLFKAYPVIVCLASAGGFAYSLKHPPSAIERFMKRLGVEPDAVQARYMRGVTWLWLAFFVGNALFTAYLAGFGTIEQWAYHTGFVSYLLMGVLFVGEYLYRLRFQARLANRSPS